MGWTMSVMLTYIWRDVYRPGSGCSLIGPMTVYSTR